MSAESPTTEHDPKKDSLEEIREKISNLSDHKLLRYLQDSFIDNPNRHELSQEDTAVLMERACQMMERDSERTLDADPNIAATVESAVQLYGDHVRSSPDQEYITDKAFKATIRLYEKHPLAVHALVGLFGQEYTVRPDIMIDAWVDSYKYPELFEDMFHSMTYLFSFGSEAYTEHILKSLDFDHPKNFSATGIFLECLGRLYTVASETSFAKEKAPAILSIIREAVEQNKGSYFLNLRARNLFEQLSRGKKHSGVQLDRVNQSQKTSYLLAEEIADVAYLESPPVVGLLDSDLGTDLSSLGQTERRLFLNFAKNKSAADMVPIKKFAHKYGEDGLRTFLSLEYDRTLGDKIIGLAETSPRIAAAIFDKYGAVIDATLKVDDYIRQQYGREVNPLIAENVRRRLIKKAKEILETFIDQVMESKTAEGQDGKDAENWIGEQLEGIRADILLLANTYKIINRERRIPLADIPDLNLETIHPGQTVPADLREQSLKIFRSNRGNYPKPLAEASQNEFTKALTDNKSEWHILKHEDQVLAFVRFEERKPGHLYVGSLNVKPDIKGTDLATSFIKELLEEKTNGYVLEAVAWENNPNLPFFIQGLRFQQVGLDPDYLGTGQKFIKLERAGSPFSPNSLPEKTSETEVEVVGEKSE